MNSQGLYQAVRSRLHFSQVAAWWSRTKGARPSYIATRIVERSLGDEHLRKFRETPVEHTFPLAGLGDGNSVKVSVWALPRMEEIPQLQCPHHPQPTEELSPPVVSTSPGPAKLPVPTTSSCPTSSPGPLLDGLAPDSLPAKGSSNVTPNNPGSAPTFVYYMNAFRSTTLVDDRLQIPCDKPGKHHCRCAEEEDDEELERPETGSSPAGGSLVRPLGGERKRRRSLPCRPPEPPPPAGRPGDAALEGLERRFKAQLSIDERQQQQQQQQQQPSLEKRLKRSDGGGPPPPPQPVTAVAAATTQVHQGQQQQQEQAELGRTKVKRAAEELGLDRLMSRLCLSQEQQQQQQQQQQQPGGILEWFSRVPGRVLGAAGEQTNNNNNNNNGKPRQQVKLRNCGNLELSPREFDEVLAVLRARTPLGKRRSALRTAKRREKYDRLLESEPKPTETKADVLLGAILRTTTSSGAKEAAAGSRRGLADISNGTRNIRRTDKPAVATVTSIDKTLPPPPAPPATTTTNETSCCCPSTEATNESSLPSVLNKRLSRLRQLFQREQDNNRSDEGGDPWVLRRNDSAEKRDKNTADCETEEGEKDDDADEGTSTKGKRANNSISRSSTKNSDKPSQKKRTRSKRELSPIRLSNCTNNNNAGEGIDEIDKSLVPSAKDQQRFRRSLENAASMVFHSRTGLPLTSSPAPLRRGSCCFDFDSSLNSVSSKRSALFELNTPPSPGAVSLEEGDRETESACDIEEVTRRRSTSRNRPQSHALLGSFEESALNGRLEPVSTVHGFTAEIGASGEFCPKHRKLPVTVFFYTLGDNDKVSSPYLAHINLGKKGYQVPRMGTIQVTLSNPLGTVVKMFVVLYDLSDMPARSHTFLRQRTLRDKTLRYLIHLRFMSGKSGRIYLHTDVRMIICRKSDVDTASDFGSEPPKELRSYIHGPTNPKFSPRC